MIIFLLIFLVLLFIYSLLIGFYRRAWNQIPTEHLHNAPVVKISVIVAVRNEEKNLLTLLGALSLQDYPRDLYEVILVDDHSEDGTWNLLFSFQSFKVIALQLPTGITSKKKAIEFGVKAASGNLIVTTDADCTMGPGWLGSFASYYASTGAKFIAAPVAMLINKSLLGIFQTLDFMTLQAITGAAVYRKFHMMCNGANLAYERDAFIAVNGFDGIDNIPSGDDMLLMQKMYMQWPDKVFYLKSDEVIVTTHSEKSWNEFFHQRIRWSSKAVHYKDNKIIYVLALTFCINLGFIVLAIASIVNVYWLTFFLLLFFAKVLIEFPFVNSAAIFFGQQRLMKFFPLLQPLHIIYVVVCGWLGRFGSYKWKSRVIKNKGRENPAKQ
jgi:cellulose synthase/poly-beta-1,6-N-acetylglucosamine synthase-like glycosyltransferase